MGRATRRGLMIGFAILFSSGAVPSSGPVQPARPDADLALILQRLKAQYADDSYARAGEWLASQSPDGHWEDVTYQDSAMASWKPMTHLSRLGSMASAYINPASPSFHSAKMLEGIVRGLGYWYQWHPISNNWWSKTIGQPLALS